MKIAPPLVISGSASLTMRMKEWQETSIASRNPSREQSARLDLASAVYASTTGGVLKLFMIWSAVVEIDQRYRALKTIVLLFARRAHDMARHHPVRLRAAVMFLR